MGNESDLVAWLAELEAEHGARALVIASIRQKLGLAPAVSGASAILPALTNGGAEVPAANTQIRGDTFFQLKIPEAIKKYLSMMKRPQKPNIIAAALKQGGVLTQGSNFYGNVFTGLKRLRAAGVVVHNKEGWGLAEWYKGMGKPQPPMPKRKRKAKRKSSGAQKVASTEKAPEVGALGSYLDFVKEGRKAGKTMKEIGAEWRAKKEA